MYMFKGNQINSYFPCFRPFTCQPSQRGGYYQYYHNYIWGKGVSNSSIDMVAWILIFSLSIKKYYKQVNGKTNITTFWLSILQ